jgi:deoxycytidylate deaminase
MTGTLRLPAAATLAVLLPLLTTRAARAEDAAATLCRGNPAYALNVIQGVLAAQLERDHDPALDAEPPSQMAAEAVEQGVKDCAETMHKDPAANQVIQSFAGPDREIAWDAFNTSCADHVASRADCIRAEVGAVRALKHMVAKDDPPGAKAMVETCQLVLKPDPPMADWRECVDLALATHADRGAANRCKTSVAWHTTTSGADAGHMLAACLTAAK